MESPAVLGRVVAAQAGDSGVVLDSGGRFCYNMTEETRLFMLPSLASLSPSPIQSLLDLGV